MLLILSSKCVSTVTGRVGAARYGGRWILLIALVTVLLVPLYLSYGSVTWAVSAFARSVFNARRSAVL